MNLKTQVDTHTSQISRLEQAMTALAEAQVKTADETRAMRRAIAALAKRKPRPRLRWRRSPRHKPRANGRPISQPFTRNNAPCDRRIHFRIVSFSQKPDGAQGHPCKW